MWDDGRMNPTQRDWTMTTDECWCYHTCHTCRLSGDWHVHEGERCPEHLYAPGDWSVAERQAENVNA